jgi:hypothetical protein
MPAGLDSIRFCTFPRSATCDDMLASETSFAPLALLFVRVLAQPFGLG